MRHCAMDGYEKEGWSAIEWKEIMRNRENSECERIHRRRDKKNMREEEEDEWEEDGRDEDKRKEDGREIEKREKGIRERKRR